MKFLLCLIFLTSGPACLFGQQHYVPLQILVPNNTLFNNSYYPPAQPPPRPNYPYNNSAWQNPAQYQPNQSVWNYTTPDGDLILGQIGHLDRLLFNQTYSKPRRWWSNREKLISYPQDAPGTSNRHETITAIRAYNRFYDGLDGQVRVVEGGIGKRYAKILISSSWGKGFKYTLQIFGR